MPDDPPRVIPIIISSTCADLGQYREEASEIIAAINERRNRVQLKDVSMERQTQSGDGEFAVKVSRDYVNQAEWMILIVGWHYGTISDEPGANGLSVTEWEYQEYEKRKAADPKMKLFVFMPGELDDPDHPSSTLFACQMHKWGCGYNKNNGLARGEKFLVVTRLA